jgi:hypothetical protein
MTPSYLTLARREVVPPEPPPSVDTIFTSDWSAGTGNTGTVVTDGGTWPQMGGADPSATLSVVAAASTTLQNGGGSLAAAGWPTTNALRILYYDSSQRVVILSTDTVLPALSVGGTRHYRQWICHDIPDAAGAIGDGSEHGTANDSTAGDPAVWQWSVDNKVDGTFGMRIRGVGMTYPNEAFGYQAFTKGVVYQRLWAFERVTSTTYRVPYVRIRTSDGTLVVDGDDFLRSDASLPEQNLTNYFASGTWSHTTSETIFRSFQSGSNGPLGWPTTGTPYFYLGRHEISDDGPLDGGA